MVPTTERTAVDCGRLFDGDDEAIRIAKAVNLNNTLTNSAFVDLARDCELFKKRGYLAYPVNREEELFPLSFSITMYKDVYQFEALLRVIYRPHNSYCVSIDKSSPADVHKGVLAIAQCFPNIIVCPDLDIQWGKFSVVKADLVSCFS